MARLFLILTLVLLTAAAILSTAARESPAPAAAGSAVAVAAAGLRVVMDPDSGEIVGRPTAEQLARSGSALPPRLRRAAELESFDLPGGARGVVLDDWADHALRVERTADGGLRTVCALGDRHGESE